MPKTKKPPHGNKRIERSKLVPLDIEEDLVALSTDLAARLAMSRAALWRETIADRVVPVPAQVILDRQAARIRCSRAEPRTLADVQAEMVGAGFEKMDISRLTRSQWGDRKMPTGAVLYRRAACWALAVSDSEGWRWGEVT